MGQIPGSGAQGPVITAQTVRMALTCERQLWLERHGDPALRGEPARVAQVLIEQGREHEIAIQRAESPNLEPIPIVSWEAGVALTRDALMARGVAGLWHGCLEHVAPLDLTDRVFVVRGQPDYVQRVEHFAALAYRAVEIKRRREPEDADWVQLDLYTWLLRQMGLATAPGELWLGADDLGRPWRRLPHEYDEDRLMAALLRAIALLDTDQEPPVRIDRHCDLCAWRSFCRAEAERRGQVDILPGVGPALRATLEAAGLTDVTAIAACSPEDLLRVRGVGPGTFRRLHASARAWVEQRPIWHGALPAECRRTGWMFDLETCESGGKVVPWSLGWCDSEGNTRIAILAPGQDLRALTLPDGQPITLAPDVESLWAVLGEAISGGDEPIYHWSAYDSTILRGSAPPDWRERLAPRFVDLLAVCRGAVSLPLRSLSIKVVAPYLGFLWPGGDDWLTAYLDYCAWWEEGDTEALARACAYQRADVQALAWVWRWLVQGSSPDR